MSTPLGFCPIHRTAYRRSLDPSCPQCSVQRMSPPAQLDFDHDRQQPIDPVSKKLLDAITLEPVV